MRIVYFILLLLSVFTFNSKAEAALITYEDSLLNRVRHSQGNLQKVKSYIDLAKFYKLNDFERAYQYSDSALGLAEIVKNKQYEYLITFEQIRIDLSSGFFNRGKTKLENISEEILQTKDAKILGNYYLLCNYISDAEGDIIESMDCGLKALNYFVSIADSSGLARVYNNVGVTYDNIGNKQKALEYYLKALTFAKPTNNFSILISSYNNLGVLYNSLINNEKALAYYKKALNLAIVKQELYTITGELNNIALIYLEDKNYKLAIKSFQEALSLTQQNNYKTDEALICYNLGELYRKLNKYDSAYYYFNTSIIINKSLNDLMRLANSYYSMAELMLGKEDELNAIFYFKKAISVLGKQSINLLVEEAHVELSKIYKVKNNYKLAYENIQKAKAISDSITKISLNNNISYADLQIEFNNKVEEYEQGLKNFQKAHNQQLNSEKQVILIIILFAILLVFVLFIVYLRFRKSHNVNALLMQRNSEIEDQKAFIEISNIELREQYAFTETLLNTIPNPVFYTNKNSNLIGCNQAFENVIGLKEDELIGVKIKDIHKQANFSCDLISNFTVDEPQSIKEGTMLSSSCTKHDIVCYNQGIIEDTDTLIGVLGIIIDVTKIREVEKSLTISKQKLKEANNAKDRFFSIMAHDLKNPFNAVLGLTQLISSKIENFNQSEIKNYANLINQSANQIYSLLENLLEWSRAQSGDIIKNPVKFDVHEPITECLDLLENSIRQKNINIEFENLKEVNVCADKNMILTVFRNLLMNAIKYTPKGGLISISTKQLYNETTIVFRDTGVGISKKNMEKLFKIDQPITTPGLQNEKGTGLGLIICKEFISQNNGSLKVDSEEGRGSTFTVTFSNINCS